MFRRNSRQSTHSATALHLQSVSKVYGTGSNAIAALDDVTLTLPARSFTAVMGPSGSGKSTFLNVAAGLDRPSSGQVVVNGTEMAGNEADLAIFRRRRIGFVFQHFTCSLR